MKQSEMETRLCCEQHLAGITNEDLHTLGLFAESRLLSLGLSASLAEDMVGKALAAVVSGTEPARGGRKPRPEDVANKEAFLNYLRGAISSVVEAGTRRQRYISVSLNEPGKTEPALTSRTAPETDVEIRDYAFELFSRLRTRAPSHLQPTLEEWEATFAWADRVPSSSSRKHAYELRKLAREVVAEIGCFN